MVLDKGKLKSLIFGYDLNNKSRYLYIITTRYKSFKINFQLEIDIILKIERMLDKACAKVLFTLPMVTSNSLLFVPLYS